MTNIWYVPGVLSQAADALSSVYQFRLFRARAGSGICTSSMKLPTSFWMSTSFYEATVSRHVMNINHLKMLTKNRTFSNYKPYGL
ncbi:hypothetical protein EG68_08622 [Paragonimus skrjabini miyazakii]|uniref:Uncharacterized protein n=1 Tax=Paragonimus skrjabini miyazakii TaxID=59628 RepID=A0A8S9YQ44_9TREM|nr:hypothetical protein EG68_08622 [Paragonimus skrjabini miyazakii]